MTNREFSKLFPDAFALCKEMAEHDAGIRISYVKTADFELGEKCPEGVQPVTETV